jgi:hypothetical protein
MNSSTKGTPDLKLLNLEFEGMGCKQWVLM